MSSSTSDYEYASDRNLPVLGRCGLHLRESIYEFKNPNQINLVYDNSRASLRSNFVRWYTVSGGWESKAGTELCMSLQVIRSFDVELIPGLKIQWLPSCANSLDPLDTLIITIVPSQGGKPG